MPSLSFPQHAISDSEPASNPLLAFQPAYTYSMPTQLLIHGIVLTLLTVLILHLLFTAKYHYPLARCNFVLLLSAVLLTQISTIVMVVVINLYLFNRSRYWPFMFDYVEVTVPLPDWNPVPLAGWYIMQGAVTFLAHATHIQFLTLLFPSSLERKLIIAFLGPLCLVASVLFFTHFLADPNLQDLGDAIRNTATSTLSLLYTFGLLIWGNVVNRKRAWEHEGGTSGFGAMSLSLALAGTAANFIEVREDRLKWLPWLVNTVLLWQSWAGFWWWVGAGMWTGEVAEIERREAKKRRREERRTRKRAMLQNLLTPRSQASSTSALSPPGLRLVRTRSSSSRLGALQAGASGVCRRLTRTGVGSPDRPPDPAAIELHVLSSPRSPTPTGPLTAPTEASSSTNDTRLPRPAFLERWLGTLSEAHNAAAKRQARSAGEIRQTEQVKRWGLRAMTQRVALERVQHQPKARLSPPPGDVRATRRTRPLDEDGDWESEDEGSGDERLGGAGEPSGSTGRQAGGSRDVAPSGSGSRRRWLWREPLMKARLRDVTSYD